MPGLGTPRLKIQVIDLEHLIDSRRAQMQWGRPHRICAPQFHFDRPRTRPLPPSAQMPAGGRAGARAGWMAARVHPVSDTQYEKRPTDQTVGHACDFTCNSDLLYYSVRKNSDL